MPGYDFVNDTGAHTEIINADEVNVNFDNIQGNFLPIGPNWTNTDNVYNLGSAANRWAKGYFGGTVTANNFNGTSCSITSGWFGNISVSNTVRYHMIPGIEFINSRPQDDDIVYLIIPTGNNYGNLWFIATTVVHAPVKLPDGVTIDDVSVYLKAGDGAGTREFWLYRKSRLATYNAAPSQMANDFSIIQNNYITLNDSSIADATIDNTLYYYWFVVKAYPLATMYSDYLICARIRYATTHLYS